MHFKWRPRAHIIKLDIRKKSLKKTLFRCHYLCIGHIEQRMHLYVFRIRQITSAFYICVYISREHLFLSECRFSRFNFIIAVRDRVIFGCAILRHHTRFHSRKVREKLECVCFLSRLDFRSDTSICLFDFSFDSSLFLSYLFLTFHSRSRAFYIFGDGENSVNEIYIYLKANILYVERSEIELKSLWLHLLWHIQHASAHTHSHLWQTRWVNSFENCVEIMFFFYVCCRITLMSTTFPPTEMAPHLWKILMSRSLDIISIQLLCFVRKCMIILITLALVQSIWKCTLIREEIGNGIAGTWHFLCDSLWTFEFCITLVVNYKTMNTWCEPEFMSIQATYTHTNVSYAYAIPKLFCFHWIQEQMWSEA